MRLVFASFNSQGCMTSTCINGMQAHSWIRRSRSKWIILNKVHRGLTNNSNKFAEYERFFFLLSHKFVAITQRNVYPTHDSYRHNLSMTRCATTVRCTNLRICLSVYNLFIIVVRFLYRLGSLFTKIFEINVFHWPHLISEIDGQHLTTEYFDHLTLCLPPSRYWDMIRYDSFRIIDTFLKSGSTANLNG